MAATVNAGTPRPVGIDELLDRERAHLDRMTPHQAAAAALDFDALLVDIRYAALRDRDGTIPGALVVERNELEWRLDPQCAYRLPEATRHDLRIVVVCNEGYASSLAARSLQALGLRHATDLIGGFQAWVPVDPGTGHSQSVAEPSPASSASSAAPSASSAARTTRSASPSE